MLIPKYWVMTGFLSVALKYTKRYYQHMEEKSAPEQIDDIIQMYGGWKGKNLSELRSIIKGVDSSVAEEVKWKMRSRPEGLPVWSRNGILCILETFKNDQKLVFFKGVHLQDPKMLFNARLNSKTDRAIEFHEGDTIDEEGLKALVLEAVQLNIEKAQKK
jgi:hypothetical protein